MFLANKHPAYKEGYNAYMNSSNPTQSDNKYKIGTLECNLFERRWTRGKQDDEVKEKCSKKSIEQE